MLWSFNIAPRPWEAAPQVSGAWVVGFRFGIGVIAGRAPADTRKPDGRNTTRLPVMSGRFRFSRVISELTSSHGVGLGSVSRLPCAR